uniref:Uncharacterized protein n=1 Tax=Anguilla anguilla TaxID=7936 RepID=A0A0E9T3E4_ANGAN
MKNRISTVCGTPLLP